MQRRSFLIGAGAISGGLSLPAMRAHAATGSISVATIGEPPSLDPMVSGTDIVGMIGQHIYETLYTFDAGWSVVPLIAAAMPQISADGLTYSVPLRTGLSFHDGSPLGVGDVLASLTRWMSVGARGQMAAGVIAGMAADGDHGLRITLKQPFAPLLGLLAFNNSAAVIVPEKMIGPELKGTIGSGPYMLKERKADQYIQLARFPGYQPRSEPASGYGGKREALIEQILFVPVPDAQTRLAGARTGQFQYADSLPVESYGQLAGSKSDPVLLTPYGWPMFVMNQKHGLFTDLRARKAVQLALSESDMLEAAFGDKKFYAVEGAMYPSNFAWHTDAGADAYDKADPAAAKQLLAGVDLSQTLHLLVSHQYEFHFKMAQVAAEYLKQAGFNVVMDVVDWATLVQRIRNPELWSIFVTHSPFLPEPALISIMSDTGVGWWNSPAKQAAVAAFNRTSVPAERVKLWAEVQRLLFEEAPLIKVGNFNALSAKSPGLTGFTPSPWPAFWNVSLSS